MILFKDSVKLFVPGSMDIYSFRKEFVLNELEEKLGKLIRFTRRTFKIIEWQAAFFLKKIGVLQTVRLFRLLY